MKIYKAINYLIHPRKMFFFLGMKGFFKHMADEKYLKLLYWCRFKRKLNLEDPQSFNEKIQWLKLHDYKELYTVLVDKYEAKKYIAKKFGEEYVIPTLGVWEKFEDIDFEMLPEKFVLKCTHDSGGLVICTDKKKLDLKKAKLKIEKSLKKNYYWVGRELPYKNVHPRIIAEAYVAGLEKSDTPQELVDYKFMCFNGVHKCSFTCTKRYSTKGLHVTFYDTDWKLMEFERHYPRETSSIDIPRNYEKMVNIAQEIAKDMLFVRVDFYENIDQLYVGEITLYPGSGFEEFRPEEWDYTMGEWLVL